MVSAPVETLSAPLQGYISEVYISPNMDVIQGTPLLKIENIEMERDLQLAMNQLEDAKIQLHYLKNLNSVGNA